MKLQINLNGAWRDVLHFAPEKQPAIQQLAGDLLAVSGERAKMRIATDDNQCVVFCQGPDYAWRAIR